VTHLEWHIFTGTEADGARFGEDGSDAGWTRLGLGEDGTRGLGGSGHLVLEIPATATALDPLDLGMAFWASFGAVRPPRDKAELADQLEDGTLGNPEGLADLWEVMGASEAQVDELAACGEDAKALAATIADAAYRLDPKKVTLADWLSVNEDYGAPLPRTAEAYRKLYWIRARLASLPADAPPPAPMRGLHLNTVPATQAATRLDDRLGRSNGRPPRSSACPSCRS
jgi:hypothetical protein